MCYRNCPHENYDGECRKKPQDLCPDSFETDQEYWDAVEEKVDEYADYKYEQARDRELFN